MEKSSCARAYFEGGCNICNSSYTDLSGSQDVFADDFVGNVQAFTLRKGCTLTLFSENNLNGTKEIISGDYLEVNFVLFQYNITNKFSFMTMLNE